MDELERLIKEQERDDTHVQRPEGQTIRLDSFDSQWYSPGSSPIRFRDTYECPIHGRSDLRVQSNGQPYCGHCNRERARYYYRHVLSRDPEKMEAKRARDRAARRHLTDERREYNREYQRQWRKTRPKGYWSKAAKEARSAERSR